MLLRQHMAEGIKRLEERLSSTSESADSCPLGRWLPFVKASFLAHSCLRVCMYMCFAENQIPTWAQLSRTKNCCLNTHTLFEHLILVLLPELCTKAAGSELRGGSSPWEKQEGSAGRKRGFSCRAHLTLSSVLCTGPILSFWGLLGKKGAFLEL